MIKSNLKKIFYVSSFLLAFTSVNAGVIVVNSSCPYAQKVAKGEAPDEIRLKQIFEGRIEKCGDGEKINRYVLDVNNPVMAEFADKIFNLDVTALFHRWGNLALSQGIKQPTVMNSTNRIIRSVTKDPHSFAILPDGLELPPEVVIIHKF